jgi:hypothetical protein
MQFPIHIHVTGPINITVVSDADLQQIIKTQQTLLENVSSLMITGDKLMAKGDALQASLSQIDALTNQLATVLQSVVTNEQNQIALINQLRAEVAAGGPAAQLLDQLDASSASRVTALQAVADALVPLASDPSNPVPDPNPEIPPVEGGEGGGETGGGDQV